MTAPSPRPRRRPQSTTVAGARWELGVAADLADRLVLLGRRGELPVAGAEDHVDDVVLAVDVEHQLGVVQEVRPHQPGRADGAGAVAQLRGTLDLLAGRLVVL